MSAHPPSMRPATGWDRVPDILLAAGLLLSYVTLREVARAAGFTGLLDDLFPLIIDGFLLYSAHEAASAAATGDRGAAWWAFLLVAGFTLLSGLLQATSAYAAYGWLGFAVHACPPVVVFLAFEMRQRRVARRRRAALAQADHERRAALRQELEPLVRAELEAEFSTRLRQASAELRAQIEAEVAERLHVDLQRMDRPARSLPARDATPATAAQPGRKTSTKASERAAEIVAANPDIKAPQLRALLQAEDIEISDTYARQLIRRLRDRGEVDQPATT